MISGFGLGLSMETNHIDQDNPAFFNAFDTIENTPACVLVSGRAGTGKTTFLSYFRESSSKEIVVLAPTGVAAVNARGQTIHSFFRIKPGMYDVVDLSDRMHMGEEFSWMRKGSNWHSLLKSIDMIVIDEVSMVRADLLDMVDLTLRYHLDRTLPFGGMQMVFIGDLFQLPPVVTQYDKAALSQLYKGPYFTDSNVMSRVAFQTIVFEKNYRQKNPQFVSVLDRIRLNQTSELDIQWLNRRHDPDCSKRGDTHIHLYNRVAEVAAHNGLELDKINMPIHRFEATMEGKFSESHIPADVILELKVGARVMFVKNDWFLGVYNGLIGDVVDISENMVDILVPGGRRVVVYRAEWRQVTYKWNKMTKKVEEEVVGTFTQFPLRLAWAITVHKSQGLTFDRVALKVDNAFTPGQVYVALSRCRTLRGIRLKSKLAMGANRVDQRMVEWCRLNAPALLNVQEETADVLLRNAWLEFKNGHINEANAWYDKAIREGTITPTPVQKRFMRRYLAYDADSNLLADVLKGVLA